LKLIDKVIWYSQTQNYFIITYRRQMFGSQTIITPFLQGKLKRVVCIAHYIQCRIG